MNKLIIQNPNYTLLPKRILNKLQKYGKIKPINGKGVMKGFRVAYSTENTKNNIEQILKEEGITIKAYTEQVGWIAGEGHLNIHEIIILETSEAFNRFLATFKL